MTTSDYDEQLPYHFCNVLAEMGLPVGLQEYDLPAPEQPVLVYDRTNQTSNLRLRMASPTGFEEEWYTLSFQVYSHMVDEVKAKMLELGYHLEVTA